MRNSSNTILFLSWESPYPTKNGSTLRTFGLLKELSARFEVELIMLEHEPTSGEALEVLGSLTTRITRVPVGGRTTRERLAVLARALAEGIPYHAALLEVTLARHPQVRRRIVEHTGPIFASLTHWGTLARGRRARNWIIDQQNADVHFWKVYAAQAPGWPVKLAARQNMRWTERLCREIYPRVGCVVAVCAEDRELTRALEPGLDVHVIENGIDCAHYRPQRVGAGPGKRLLFTGTSAMRNMVALRGFLDTIWPHIQRELPEAELTVGGNFTAQAQAEFAGSKGVHFTGKVDDMRPIFDQSDVYILPFSETHGSKLKVAEAMAMGMPIVATPEGVRGFALEHEQSVLIAHSAEEFAAHAVRLLRRPDLRQALGAKAREVALGSVDWSVLGARLALVVTSLESERHGPRLEARAS